MLAGVQLSRLRRVKASEYLLRFVLGGLATLIAGLVAHGFGPTIGGLFLAFPAILPASATIIEKHETEKKRRHGLDGKIRGRRAAALDALGAALGAIGLIPFGLVAWQMLPGYQAVFVLCLSTLVWFGTSLIALAARRMAQAIITRASR